MRRVFVGPFLFLAACASSNHEHRPDEKIVHHLDIQGAHAVSTGDIEEKIATSAPGFWPWDSKTYFDPNTWQADLRRIERFYQAEGYYQAQVVDDEVKPLDKNKVDLKVVVDEGPPTKMQSVEVQGLDELPPDFQKKVRAAVPLKPGEVFKEEAWEDAKNRVKSELRELGYAEARAAGEVIVETTNQTARAVMHVTPGLRYKFGGVFVVMGPRPRVKPKPVVEQAEGAIKAGEWFSDSAIAEAQKRVFNMGVFGAVKVYPSTPKAASQTIPVIVDVREAPFHSIRVGPGFELDPVREQFRVIAEYTDRDFFGGLRKFTLRGNVGYAFMPTVWAVLINNTTSEPSKQGPIGDARAEFTQPHFLARDLKFQTSLEGERGLDQAYDFWSGRGRLGVSWQPVPSLTIFPSYNYEIDRLNGTALGASSATPALVLGCPTNPCTEHISYLEQTVEWDKRDDRYEPSRGYYLSLSLQEGGGPFGGDFRFVRILPDIRAYYSPFRKLTLAARLRAGTMLTPPGEQSPIISRFYSGGNSMRGFGNRRLSPMLAEPIVAPYSGSSPIYSPTDGVFVPGGNLRYQGQTVAIGGNGLLEASFEARYQLFGPLVVAAFWDMGLVSQCRFGARPVYATRSLAGIVSSDVKCEADPDYLGNNMQYAVGTGVRFRIVVPVRIDFAFRPNIGSPLPVVQLPGYDVVYPKQGTCFGIGDKGQTIAGSPEGPCTITLSVGEAF